MNTPSKTKVLYIVGWRRSGTTVLGNVLGSTPGAFFAGELTYLFTPEHPNGFECSCGEHLYRCPVWSPTVADSQITWENREEVHDARLASARMRHVPRAYREWNAHHRPPNYSEYLSRVYRSLERNTDAQLIVDSSKSPGSGLAAIAAPGVETRVLHVVRDPRACAYSTSKRVKRHGSQSGQLMKKQSGLTSSTRWVEFNSLADHYLRKSVPTGHYMRLRYEDLMSDPHSTLAEVASWVGLEPSTLPFIASNYVQLQPGHTVMGNPNRHHTGPVSLTLDQEWQTSMKRTEQIAATIPATPLMRRYGYSLLPS